LNSTHLYVLTGFSNRAVQRVAQGLILSGPFKLKIVLQNLQFMEK